MGLILDARGAHNFGSAGSDSPAVCVGFCTDGASLAYALSQEPGSSIVLREPALPAALSCKLKVQGMRTKVNRVKH